MTLVRVNTKGTENGSNWCKTRNGYIFLVLLTIPFIYIYSMMNKSTDMRKRFDFIKDLMFVLDQSNYTDRALINQSQINPAKLSLNRKRVTILAWTPFFRNWTWYSINTCPLVTEGLCHITVDKNRVSEADAILFHWRDVHVDDVPKPKQSNQTWILYNYEPPMFTSKHVAEKLGSFVDVMMTYRLDSDIYAPYGRFHPRTNNGQLPLPLMDTLTEEEFNKKSLVSWLVSNCKAHSKRQRFVKEMRTTSNIPVDIFGSCTNRWTPLCNKDVHRNICYESLGKRYKFYLSFENALCRDYVTEKFYTALVYGMVPVVLGGSDYTKIAPEGSYINAMDFESPKHLGEYLNLVGNNFTLYQRYLNWTRYYYINPKYDLNEPLCDVCSYMLDKMSQNGTNMANKRVDNLSKWWYDEAKCWVWRPSQK